MNFWQDLVNTALLGTGKKNLDADGLPDGLRELAGQVAPGDREAQLLKIAALATQYVRAGQGAGKRVLPALPACAPETAPHCPAPATRLLRTLLVGGQSFGPLPEYWLDKCLEKGWVVPPDHLVPLLDAGMEKQYHSLQGKLRQAAGKRGRWLAETYGKWPYVSPADADPARTWQEGRPAQRKEAFRTVREQDPATALRWLEQAWPEESAKDRKDLLELLRINLGPADEAFLESRRQEALALGDKAKAIHQEIKVLATQLLLSLPGSALGCRAWESVTPYFQRTEKTFTLMGKAVVQLVLPEAEDEFLNVGVMHGQFGLDKSSPLPGYTDAKYWLHELIRYFPPARWEEHFGEEAAWVLGGVSGPQGGFRSSREKGTHPLFATALADAIYLHRDAVWASAWLRLFPKGAPGEGQQQAYRLCELLPQAELERFVTQHVDQPAAPGILADVLTSRHRPQWSLSFTHVVLKSIRQSAEEYYRIQQGQAFLEKAILHIPDGILNGLEPYRQAPAGGGYALRQWLDRIETPLSHLLQIRQEIEKMS